jgi:hypothetical protein
MYHRLGRGGRSLWTMVTFVLWCYVTWSLMHWTLTSGMELGEGFRLWLRSEGLATIFSDFFKLFISLVGFLGIPILTTVVFTKINRKVKGSPMQDKDNPYHRHLESCQSCRNNPLNVCEEADRSVRQAVDEGSSNQSDREMDEIRNGRRDD